MAKPMTPDQLLVQLRKWGVKYAEYRSWRTHNRDSATGKTFGPVNGFMVHHTGSDSKDQRALLYGGIAGLPGPLSHFGLAQDGTVWLIGWGRANHAGSGDPDVLNAVVNESYGDYPPADNQSIVDGNDHFYGVEVWYSGSHRMTDAQYESLRRLAAAVCDFHGWSSKSVIGHGEWGSPGKWDPGYAPGRMMDMSAVRSDIASTLAGKVDKPSAPAPTPSAPAATYTVKGGDTLSGIGRKLGIGWEALAAANGIVAPYVIKPGQVLKVPSGSGPAPAPAPKPVVDLSKLEEAARRNPSAKGTPVTYAGVRTVEAALVKAGLLDRKLADGHYGTATVKAYAAWQRKCGYSGAAADGVPGWTSLRKLAAKYGFTVTR
ncbi:N-acetylmuramoyl-L-alanine amidase [Streptomyces sp. bgisy032]|uniref:N-acetylmuramoyl-L-alanine amidase n=1 Tax=Streptomyces sp. bgisy032 TaxID=3413773 RepID=UPI003D74ADBF